MPSSSQSPSPPSVDQVAAALGRVPSGLFIVTWRADGSDRPMLASWVMQAGFDPPSVSVAVGPTRDLLAAVRDGQPFVVNVLAESQRSLLGRFGKPPAAGADPFAGLAVERTPAGIIAISDAAAWLECRPVGEAVAAGVDHVIVLGRIEAAGGQTGLAPLVHVRRNGRSY